MGLASYCSGLGLGFYPCLNPLGRTRVGFPRLMVQAARLLRSCFHILTNHMPLDSFRIVLVFIVFFL